MTITITLDNSAIDNGENYQKIHNNPENLQKRDFWLDLSTQWTHYPLLWAKLLEEDNILKVLNTIRNSKSFESIKSFNCLNYIDEVTSKKKQKSIIDYKLIQVQKQKLILDLIVNCNSTYGISQLDIKEKLNLTNDEVEEMLKYFAEKMEIMQIPNGNWIRVT